MTSAFLGYCSGLLHQHLPEGMHGPRRHRHAHATAKSSGTCYSHSHLIDEQHAIAVFLDRETDRIDALASRVERAIERLQEHRTALITAAVTGKIDVRE